MPTVLSTKTLLPKHKELLLNGGCGLVEFDAITIEPISFECPKQVPHALVTSKNAVRSVLEKGIEVGHFYCVGDRTKSLLEKNGQKVIKWAKNAQELADLIQFDHKKDKIYFFCGNRRRDELPFSMHSAGIPFEEIITYHTHFRTMKFDRTYDAVLFFSPSGVESYLNKNELGDSWAICIGNTTAAALPTRHQKIAIANTPSTESVIAKAVKTVSNYD